MKNIYFVEAKSPGANIFSKMPMPRLGSILLGTILKNKGYNTKVFIEDIAMPDLKQLDDADMVCVSSITSTAPRAFQIAEHFKKLGIPVAIGGPHSTFLPEESLQYADYVVRGEGEETIVELVEHLEAGKPLDAVSNHTACDSQTGKPTRASWAATCRPTHLGESRFLLTCGTPPAPGPSLASCRAQSGTWIPRWDAS